MDPFLKMDVFFVVTTLAVLVLTVLVCLVLYRLWQFIGTLNQIAGQVADETKVIREDIADLRRTVKSEGNKWIGGIGAIRTIVEGLLTRKKSRAKKQSSEGEV